MDAKQVWEEANTLLMPQYGTSMHWPYCQQANCTGCISAAVVEGYEKAKKLDLSIFRKDVD